MKPSPIVIAVFSAVLAACSAQQAPAQSTPASEPLVAAPAVPTQAQEEIPMGKRAPGDTTPPMTVFRAFGNEPFWNVNVEDATLRQDMTARELTGDERATWWERAVAAWPDYAGYQKKTDRQIPVFVLEPSS